MSRKSGHDSDSKTTDFGGSSFLSPGAVLKEDRLTVGLRGRGFCEPCTLVGPVARAQTSHALLWGGKKRKKTEKPD